MKLSVIIPAYNGEEYLERCIDSVLSQKLQLDEIEIIVVDDGSTDRSAQIIDNYSMNNKNVHVIHQDNQGVSAARKNGIAVATGDFIHFLDSDDFLLYDNAYKVLLDLIRSEQNHVEVLNFYMTRVDKYNQQHLDQYYNLDSVSVLYRGTGKDVCHDLRFEGYMCASLYSANLIKNHLHCIDTRVFLSEDTLFNLELYLSAKHVVQTNAMVYGYFANPQSATLTNDKEKLYKLIDNLFMSIEPTVMVLDRYNDEVFKTERMRNHGKAIAKRLMMLNAPYKVTKKYLQKGFEKGVFPILNKPAGQYERFLNVLINYPMAFWVMSCIFRYVVHPCVKPLIPKN